MTRSALRRTLSTAVLGTVAGTVLLTTPPVTAATEPAAGGQGDAEDSIVFVVTEWTGYVQYPTEDGGWAWSDAVELQGTCTGWFASDVGHIVTAGHCVDPEEVKADVRAAFLARNDASHLEEEAAGWAVEGRESSLPDRTDVWVVQPAGGDGAVIDDPTTVHVLDFQPFRDGDLALLKANGLSSPTTPLTVAAEAPSVGDAVTAIGYPANVRSISDFSRLRASFKSGTVSSTQVSESGVAGLEVNADIAPGMSGGPTVDAHGDVLGVNSATFVDQSSNFVTDGAALRTFLAQHGVDVAVAPAGETTGPVGDTTSSGPVDVPDASGAALPGWPYLAGAGAGALLLAAGGAHLLGRRGRGVAGVAAGRPAPAFAVPAPAPAYAGAGAPVDPTRLIRRNGPVGPAGYRPPCDHSRNAPGARFCGDCGTALAA